MTIERSFRLIPDIMYPKETTVPMSIYTPYITLLLINAPFTNAIVKPDLVKSTTISTAATIDLADVLYTVGNLPVLLLVNNIPQKIPFNAQPLCALVIL
jgi:hypothetical protein